MGVHETYGDMDFFENVVIGASLEGMYRMVAERVGGSASMELRS